MGKRGNSDSNKARLIDTPETPIAGDPAIDQPQTDTEAAASPANDQASPETPIAGDPAPSGKVRAQLLSDTAGTGRDLPAGVNGQIIEVSAAQFAANSDMLRAV